MLPRRHLAACGTWYFLWIPRRARWLLPPVRLLTELTPLTNAGCSLGYFKGSNCPIGCFGGSGLLLTPLAPPSNKISQNMLGRSSVSAQQEKRVPKRSKRQFSVPGCSDWSLLESALWPGNRSLQLVSACTRLGLWGVGLTGVGMRLVVAIGTGQYPKDKCPLPVFLSCCQAIFVRALSSLSSHCDHDFQFQGLKPGLCV